jgi:protein associated with RNAse G/E
MKHGEEITVRSLKHGGRAHRTWSAHIETHEGSLIVLDAFFAEEVRHPILGIIEAGTLSREFFWTDRWYSIFRFGAPAGGGLLNFYCNVNTPARLEAGSLYFTDLDVDVLVKPDLSYSVLDEDEFERHAELYSYPPEYRVRAREALDQLVSLIEGRQFPFNFNSGDHRDLQESL